MNEEEKSSIYKRQVKSGDRRHLPADEVRLKCLQLTHARLIEGLLGQTWTFRHFAARLHYSWTSSNEVTPAKLTRQTTLQTSHKSLSNGCTVGYWVVSVQRYLVEKCVLHIQNLSSMYNVNLLAYYLELGMAGLFTCGSTLFVLCVYSTGINTYLLFLFFLLVYFFFA